MRGARLVTGRHVHRAGTLILSAIMLVLGVILIAETIVAADGALSYRLLIGVLFLIAGIGRLYVELRRGRSG